MPPLWLQEMEDGTLVSNSTSLGDLEARAAELAEEEEDQMVKDFRRNLDYNMMKVCPPPPPCAQRIKSSDVEFDELGLSA